MLDDVIKDMIRLQRNKVAVPDDWNLIFVSKKKEEIPRIFYWVE